jgi:hypothetical protein
VSIPALFSNEIGASGISIGSRADQQDTIREITANRLKPVIDRSFPLQEIVALWQGVPRTLASIGDIGETAAGAAPYAARAPAGLSCYCGVPNNCSSIGVGPRRLSRKRHARG